MMQLSSDTIKVLKNFGNINQGIYFKQGKVLKTMSSGKNILAEVTIKEDIPTSFGIYDLNKFLSVVSLHSDNPTFQFGDKRPGDPAMLVADISFAKSVLQYRPEHDIISIIRTAYNWETKEDEQSERV